MRPVRRALGMLAATLVVVGAVVVVPPAQAQGSGVTLQILRQSPWSSKDHRSTLTINVAAYNGGEDRLTDLRMEVAFGPHIESRGDYSAVLASGPDTIISQRHRARSRRGGAGRQPHDRDHDRPRRGARDRSGGLADLPRGRAAADRRHRARLARDAGDLPGSRSRGADAVVHVGATPGADRLRGRRGARRYLVPGRDRARWRVARSAGRDLGRDRRAAPARTAGPRDRPAARDAGEGSRRRLPNDRRDRGGDRLAVGAAGAYLSAHLDERGLDARGGRDRCESRTRTHSCPRCCTETSRPRSPHSGSAGQASSEVWGRHRSPPWRSPPAGN